MYFSSWQRSVLQITRLFYNSSPLPHYAKIANCWGLEKGFDFSRQFPNTPCLCDFLIL